MKKLSVESKQKFLQSLKTIENEIREIKQLLTEEPEIIDLKIRPKKIVAHLNNGQKPEVPIDWFAKWGVENVTAEKLKNYEIWRGRNIYFPKIDEVLGIEKFIGGFDVPCE